MNDAVKMLYAKIDALQAEVKSHHEALEELVEALEFASCVAESGHIDETFARYADSLVAKHSVSNDEDDKNNSKAEKCL